MTYGQRDDLAALKANPGKDIWLLGGGSLFRSLAEDGFIETVEIGSFSVREYRCCRARRTGSNSLTAHRVYKKAGVRESRRLCRDRSVLTRSVYVRGQRPFCQLGNDPHTAFWRAVRTGRNLAVCTPIATNHSAHLWDYFTNCDKVWTAPCQNPTVVSGFLA